MIKYGKLIKYDNNVGIIIDDNGNEHIVLRKDIKSDEIKINDYVKFTSETFLAPNNDYNMARFVNKLSLKK